MQPSGGKDELRSPKIQFSHNQNLKGISSIFGSVLTAERSWKYHFTHVGKRWETLNEVA